MLSLVLNYSLTLQVPSPTHRIWHVTSLPVLQWKVCYQLLNYHAGDYHMFITIQKSWWHLVWEARVHQLHDPRSKREVFSLIQIPGAKVERYPYSPKHVLHRSIIHMYMRQPLAYSGPWHPGTDKKYVCTILFIYSKHERTKQLAWKVVTLIRTHPCSHQGEAYYLFGTERNRLIKMSVKCLMIWKRERERPHAPSPPLFGFCLLPRPVT